MREPSQEGEIFDWNVAVYSANEAARLQACLRSVTAALGARRALITVIANGARDGSVEIATDFAKHAGVQVFSIDYPDKSNAINQFINRLRVPARAYAAVDGYSVVGAETFIAIENRLRVDPHALAVTGVALKGRSMAGSSQEALRVGGRLHGQLHAIRGEFLDRMIARAIKLPVGLYRGDGLLGSMLAHNLEPLTEPWDNSRIPAVAQATFETPPITFFSGKEIRRQFNRRVRQMRGLIENEGIKKIIYRTGYQSLPDHADDIIRDYLAVNGAPVVPLANRLFLHLAIKESNESQRPAPEALLAKRVI
jgi:hypothetical protein